MLAAIAGQNRPKSRRTRHQQNAHKNKNVLNVSITFVLLVLSVRELNVLIRICLFTKLFFRRHGSSSQTREAVLSRLQQHPSATYQQG